MVLRTGAVGIHLNNSPYGTILLMAPRGVVPDVWADVR